jgi:hypothetical protein
MFIRCAVAQQGALSITVPDHNCGSRGSETGDTGQSLAAVQGEGVITDYRALGTLPGDQLDGAPVDAFVD